MRWTRRIFLALLFALSGSVTGADTPVVNHLDPEQGLLDEVTTLAVHGGGFLPGARVSLLDGGRMRLLGSLDMYPDGPRDIELMGNFAVVVTGPGVRIVDVSDPAAPRVHGWIDLDGNLRRVALEGDRAYVATFRQGVHIVDLSDPAQPEGVGRIDHGGSFVADVAVEGGIVLVASGRNALEIYDARDPGAPRLLAQMEPGSVDYPLAVETAGGLAYLAAGWTGLQIVDFRDPAHPLLLGSRTTPFPAIDVAVSGDHAYVAGNGYWWNLGSLVVIDVRDPGEPSTVGECPVVEATRVAVHGSTAVVTDYNGRSIHVIDVSSPEDPRKTGVHRSGGKTLPVTISDGHVYAGVSHDLLIVDVETAPGPEPVISEIAGEGTRFVQIGDYVYRLVGQQVAVIDVSDPARAVVAATVPLTNGVNGLAVSGGYLLTCGGSLAVYDVSSPAEPSLVGELPVAGTTIPYPGGGTFPGGGIIPDPGLCHGNATRIAVEGDRAYLSVVAGLGGYLDDGYGLWVVDLSDPAAPSLVSNTWLARNTSIFGEEQSLAVRNFAADENRVHATVWRRTCWNWDPGGGDRSMQCYTSYRLHSFDVADPAAPAPLPRRAVGGGPLDVSGSKAYVSLGSSMGVWDVSDPAAPLHLGEWEADGGIVLIDVEQETALVGVQPWVFGELTRQLYRVDVSDPERPVTVERHAVLPGQEWNRAFTAALSGDHAFVSGASFQVLRMNPGLPGATWRSGEALEVDVPPNLHPGAYDVRVTNPDGEPGVLFDGYRVCPRRELAAALVAEPSGRGWGNARGESWMLKVDGDDLFFDTATGHEAGLLLPELPDEIKVEFLPGDGSGRTTVELLLPEDGTSAVVRLIGDDPSMLDALWAEISTSGRIAPPRIDDHRYGPLFLEVRSRQLPGAGLPGDRTETLGVAADSPVPNRFVYEFEDGALVAARTDGVDVDLVFEAVGKDRFDCETRSVVRFTER